MCSPIALPLKYYDFYLILQLSAKFVYSIDYFMFVVTVCLAVLEAFFSPLIMQSSSTPIKT